MGSRTSKASELPATGRGPGTGRSRPDCRPLGAAPARGATPVVPVEGDVLYPANDMLQTSEATLDALRASIATDSEGFLLDNVLMAVQFFRNYRE